MIIILVLTTIALFITTLSFYLLSCTLVIIIKKILPNYKGAILQLSDLELRLVARMYDIVQEKGETNYRFKTRIILAIGGK